jgi:hypothetical protein
VSDQTTRAGLPIAHFANQKAFEAWLAKQPAACPGLWLRLKKKGGDLASTLTKQEAIDSALCHGWIDGQLDTYEEGSFLIRLTPRRPKSKWSAVNAKRAAELVDTGRMRASGQAEIDRLAVGHFRLLASLGADVIVAFRERSGFTANAKRIADGAERVLGVFEAERTERLQLRHRQLVWMVLA